MSATPGLQGSVVDTANPPSAPQEVADLCQPVEYRRAKQVNVFLLKLKTGTFMMQKLWSNETGGAGKCVEGSRR